MLVNLRNDISKISNSSRAKVMQRFFKTGVGEYGEGDVFIGLSVPQSRQLASKYISLPPKQIETLLGSGVHEERLIALLILVNSFTKHPEKRKQIYESYLKFTKYTNNWDLVDLSADKIMGVYLLDQKDRKILQRLAKSANLWERRISIIATFAFIKKGNFEETLKIAEMLINDKEDLIQKAVGWMLREVGKKNQSTLEGFLAKHYKVMGRTALRYAIEKFPDSLRLRYLKGDV